MDAPRKDEPVSSEVTLSEVYGLIDKLRSDMMHQFENMRKDVRYSESCDDRHDALQRVVETLAKTQECHAEEINALKRTVWRWSGAIAIGALVVVPLVQWAIKQVME